MLEARELTCVRGDRALFERLSFTLQAGTALHVVGANGSGKTSLLRMLCGLSAPAAGEVMWRGERIRSQREEYFRELVYVGHAAAVKDDLTAVENLRTAATLGGASLDDDDVLGALETIGLGGREDLPARVLSQGQRRRVVLARLLLPHAPTLWVLDEPFNALDKRAVQQLIDTIGHHLQRGGALIVTTHQEVPLPQDQVQRLDLDRRH